MLQAIIISKDRACQLDALLQSIQRFTPNLFRIRVNFVYSNKDYLEGYERLIRKHPDVDFWLERSLKNDFVDAIERSPSNIFTIFTDDCLFFRPVQASAKDIQELFNFDRTLFCFSFRLGLNTVIQDYATGRLQPPLTDTFSFRQFIGWDWRRRSPTDNYGYPIHMDGATYVRDDILPATKALDFSTFRSWEGTLAIDGRRQFEHQPLMASFENSVLVNIPTNGVQVPPIPCGTKYPISCNELNERFLAGEVIDFDRMDFREIRGAHQELELKFSNV